MKLLFCIILFGSILSLKTNAQSFPDKCAGKWIGMMYIYKHGVIRDSVKVVLTVSKIKDVPAWNWKTEYLSSKLPMTKDYILRLKDSTKQWYITDEGGGVELHDYVFGNKLYTIFETEGVMLTSSYELINDKLVFEVTSGKKIFATNNGITNYTVENLQRVEFSRE